MSQARPEIVVTDDELAALLQAAAADESFGRMIRCSDEQEIRDLVDRLRSEGS